jgi:hypothetical protein
LALVYERRAEEAMADQDIISAQEFLQLAVSQQERVIDLNPDSAADREKLVSLRMKLSGHVTILPVSYKKKRAPIQVGIRLALRSAPPQLLAAVGVFFILVIVGMIVVPGGDKKLHVTVRPESSTDDSRIKVAYTPGAGEQTPNPVVRTGPSDLSVYTYPPPPPRAQSSASESRPIPSLSGPEAPQPEVQPAKLPSLGPDLGIVSPTKPTVTIRPVPSKPGATKSKSNPAPAPPRQAAVDTTSQVDGSSMLARAIGLHNEGKTQEAMIAAQQAIGLFQSDIAVGKNTTAAQRGVENAKKFIQLWQSSISTVAQ